MAQTNEIGKDVPQGFGNEGNAMPVETSAANTPIVKEAAARSLADALQKADAQIKSR